MWLRLRQIALVASDIERVVADLKEVFGLEVAFIDPGVGFYGLENRLLPIGSQLLEVVAPVKEGTAGGRYLDRRGGDGGYMVITQCDDHARRRVHVQELGIRTVTDRVHDEHCIMQLHPKDTGGSFLEMDWHRDLLPAGAWPPAGDNWRDFVRTERVSAITAAEIQADQPRALAARWSEIVEIDVVADAAGNPTIALTNAIIRFVPIADGRPEGLSALDLTATDAPAVLAAARARRLPVEGDTVTVCGTRFRVSAA